MSKFKTKFTLKQHTPIIHFQANQSGATLRATELKPKFDKFLLKNKPTLPKRVNSNGYDSLDYKVKIEPNLAKSRKIDSKKSMFFGNMGDEKEKEYKKYEKNFTIEFFSFEKEILEAIEQYFEAFLANTNFGTRQSKGYGGFYLDNRDLDISLIPYKVFSFKSSHWEKDIRLFYQFLRQGINLPRPSNPFYSKPAIFTYAKSKGWQWDKKAIKEEFFRSALETQLESHPNSDILKYSSKEKYLLRDLFGLSSTQEWMSYKTTVTKESKNKETVGSKRVDKIERFKSPITFKIVNNIVYFWANNSYKKVLGEPFIIKIKGNRETLELPYPKEFDFEDFLNYVLKIDLNKHIGSKFHNTSEFKTLERILNDIKVNR